MTTVLRNVRVLIGEAFTEPCDVSFDSGILSDDAGADPDMESIDAAGGYLIPGLIDCHVHLHGPETLRALAAYGVTSAMDMSSPAPLVDALRGLPGVTDIRSPLMAASSPESAHAQRLKAIPAASESLVASASEAESWVARHHDQGADYIKIVIDLPGFDQETVDALVDAAHSRGLKVVAHASRADAVGMAKKAGVDILTHAPLDRPIDASQAAELAAAGVVIVPTLTMMRGIVENLRAKGIPGPVYEPARVSVAEVHAAGMPILAGTDSNATPAAPASPPFGTSLHDELELLVAAGLSPVEALSAATWVAADCFGLTDRGRIVAGLRADLVLLDADPTRDMCYSCDPGRLDRRRARRLWTMKLTGNTILITGGGSGIGRGLAEELHARGNTVIVAGHRADMLADVSAAIPQIDTVLMDVSDPASIAGGAADVLAQHPGLNVLVNNAGIMFDDDPTSPLDDEELLRIVSTNLLGPIRVISAFVAHLRAVPDAAIVNVTSMLGYVPLARASLYSATKAAMHSYTLSLRYRLADVGPRVIEIAPPLTRTGLQEINLSDIRAMPLDQFLAETLEALASDEPEAYVARARERRDAVHVDDVGITRRFNDMMNAPTPGQNS